MISDARKNTLRRSSKISEEAVMLAALHFCMGMPIRSSAKACNVSARTSKTLVSEFRSRLARRRFARWHRANTRLITQPDEDVQTFLRQRFFETLSGCYGNRDCVRNYEAGNRSRRVCRACPLPPSFTSAERLSDALTFLDTIRDFYRRIGFGTERSTDPVINFALRAIHTSAISAALQDTRNTERGLPDLSDDGDLSVRSLFVALITELDAEPL